VGPNGGVQASGGTLDLSFINVSNLSSGTLTGGIWAAGVSGGPSGNLNLPGSIVTNSATLLLRNAGSQILANGTNALAGFNANQAGNFLVNNASFSTSGNFTNNNGSLLASVNGASITVNGNLTNSNNSQVSVGNLSAGGTLKVTGNLNNDATSTVQAQNGSTVTVVGALTSNGTVQTQTGSTVTLGGTLTNNGTLTLQSSGDHIIAGSLTSSGTVTVGSGATLATANGANITGGILQGTGAVNGAVTIASGGILLPGSNVTTPGTLTFGNGLALGGTLDEVINGGSAGQFGLINAGSFALNSSSILNLLQASGYNPAAGTMLTILTSGSPVSGTFGTIQNSIFNSGNEIWHVLYNQGGNNIVLEAFNNGGTPVTATWSGASGNWTTATQWSCSPSVSSCVPNNGGVQNYLYTAVLNSTGHTLTLDSTSNPISPTVDSVQIKAGTLSLGAGGTLTVNGAMSLSPGAQLSLSGGTLSEGGSLTVASGTISGAGSIKGPGSLTAAGNGAVSATGKLDVSGINVTNLSGGTLTGGFWQANGSGAALKLAGDISTNSANIYLFFGGSIVDSANANALAGLNANQGGTLAVYGAAYGITGNFLNNNASTLYAGLGGSLTVNGNLTNSNGSVVQADGSTITVTGNLINDVSSTVKTSSGNGKLTVSGSLTNSGVLSLLTSSNAVNLGSLTSTGTVSVAAGATLTTTGGASISGGILEGAGTVNGAITVASSAVLLPGSNTTTPGTLTFGNGVTFGGTLEEVVNSGSAGQFGLINAGALTLNASSTLQILQAGSYNPAAGTILTIATTSTPISGTFGSILNASFNGGSEIWHVLYNQGGDNIELEAFNVAPTPVTATASGSFGNWTKSSFWSCAPGPSTCIPNNGGPQNYAYSAILKSGAQLTLDSSSSPANVTVDSVSLQSANLNINSGASLTVNKGFTITAGQLMLNGGSVSVNGALTNSVNGTIAGAGTISGGGNLANSGTVLALGTLDLSGIATSNLSGGTLTGGTWSAGNSGASGTLKIAGDIVTNSAAIYIQNTGSKILDAVGANALGGLSANQSGSLHITTGANFATGGNFTNNNSSVIAANSGGSFTVNGNLTNSNSSVVNIGNAVTGGGGTLTVNGNLNNDSTSSVTILGGNSVINVAGTFTNNGAFRLNNVGDVANVGSLVNNGTVDVAAGETLNDSLTNSGRVTVAGTHNVIGSFTNSTSGVITVNSGATMNVNASAGPSTNTNNGTINLSGILGFTDAGHGNAITISGSGTINMSSGGAITGSSDETLTIAGNTIAGAGAITGFGQVVNQGTIQPGAGQTISLGTAAYSQASGTTNVLGTFTAGSLSIAGGTLQGTGTVNGATTVSSGGTVLAGTNATTPGTLTFGNGLTLGGTLDEVINGGSAGQFGAIKAGSILLNASSSLNILQSGSYDPAAGTFLVLSSGAPVSGTFGSIQNATFNGGAETWHALYGSNFIELEAFNTAVTPRTATWTGSIGGSQQTWSASLWTCTPGPVTCVNPNNGGPQNYGYSIILNSSGTINKRLTLNSSVTVDSVQANGGTTTTLIIAPSGSLTVNGNMTVHNELSVGGSLSVGGTLLIGSGGIFFGGGGSLTVGAMTVVGSGQVDGGDFSNINLTNFAGTTLTGGNWNINSGTLKLPGNIVTNSANIYLGNGAEILNPGNTSALAGLNANQGGTFYIFSGSFSTAGSFTNNNGSLFDSSLAGALTVNGNLTNSNKSVVQAQQGGILTVTGNLTNDSSSTVQTQLGGGNTLNVTGTFFNNGTFSLLNSGDVANLGALVNTGNVHVVSGATLNDSLTNSGTIVIDGTHNVTGSFTNNLGGIININSGGALNVDASGGPSSNLNDGSININHGSLNFTDNGLGNAITISGAGSINLLNGGLITGSADETLDISGAAISGNGSISGFGQIVNSQGGGTTTIQSGGVIDVQNFYVNGTTQVDGTLISPNVQVAAGGQLTGNGGTIVGNLTNAGILSPGTGTAPGTLSVNGNVTLTPSSTFVEQIAGLNTFGQLLVSGSLFLDGTLDIQLLAGYTPSIGSTFLFIDPPAISGAFATINGSTINASEEFEVIYNANNVELCVVSTSNPVCSAPPPPAVPEPRSIVLLGTAIAAALWRLRKRRGVVG
jgi:hypothetical protein